MLRARDRWREVDRPGGPVGAAAARRSCAGDRPRMDPVPAVGEHTDAVLAELGRTPEEIADLARRKVILTGAPGDPGGLVLARGPGYGRPSPRPA